MTWPEWDTSLLLAINHNHNHVLDLLMWWVSQSWIWSPLYIFLLAVLFKRYGMKNTVSILVAFGVLILCTDFLNLHCIKNTVERLRPTHEPSLINQLHLLNDSNGNPYLGGPYGFLSSHAANHFGIAFLVSELMKNIFRYATIIFFGWALLIAYSRVYMGVHYPLDVICGGAFGVFFGWTILMTLRRFVSF